MAAEWRGLSLSLCLDHNFFYLYLWLRPSLDIAREDTPRWDMPMGYIAYLLRSHCNLITIITHEILGWLRQTKLYRFQGNGRRRVTNLPSSLSSWFDSSSMLCSLADSSSTSGFWDSSFSEWKKKPKIELAKAKRKSELLLSWYTAVA